MNNPLLFNIAMGRTKPENIRHKDADCPFCHPEQLTDILAQDGSIIWLMNKYPVLERTWQTVIIEGDDCHSEYSRFPLDKAEHVLSFSLEKWQETMARPEFTSVLYFKNYGPMSGGSIRHPHSQIVGLYDYDYREDIKEYHLDGWTVGETDAYRITISDKPIIGFFEFNIQFDPHCHRRVLALRIQQILRYLLGDFSRYAASYNLFFYDLHSSHYYVKIVPRYLTSPLYVGYRISQVGNDERIHSMLDELRAAIKN
ncbi:DUF4931 domain-containing protein [uncultured Veillonella sp.]|jgi:galactose-1-phosphate uridylyltransferase|uniref:DUF4931 domain-containing protein n=1 Tax=uncultured Veillonella sp. TaxID=159268 RepID=UPI0025878255|nr:DUF4931 domain-containing protein [uncultured Veillonella sp.]